MATIVTTGLGQGSRRVMICLEPEVCFFFLSFFIYYTNDYLKAAKPTNGNDKCSRGGNGEKGSLRYVYIYIKFFIILY